jgi:hypothetical protein
MTVNDFRRVLALFLILVILCAPGCKGKKADKARPAEVTSSEDNISVDDSEPDEEDEMTAEDFEDEKGN